MSIGDEHTGLPSCGYRWMQGPKWIKRASLLSRSEAGSPRAVSAGDGLYETSRTWEDAWSGAWVSVAVGRDGGTRSSVSATRPTTVRQTWRRRPGRRCWGDGAEGDRPGGDGSVVFRRSRSDRAGSGNAGLGGQRAGNHSGKQDLDRGDSLAVGQ